MHYNAIYFSFQSHPKHLSTAESLMKTARCPYAARVFMGKNSLAKSSPRRQARKKRL